MKFLLSLNNAFKGLILLIRTESNFQIQFIVALLVVVAGILVDLSINDWTKILLCIGWVMSMEAINTAIEKTLDKSHPFHDPTVGMIKDIAAGAVMIAALISVIIGIMVFKSYLLS